MILVKIYWNTEADGSPVPEDIDIEDGPLSYYGPFSSVTEAEYWMEDEYPDGDTDVRDMVAGDFHLHEDVYINPPNVIHGGIPDEDIRFDDPREIHGP